MNPFKFGSIVRDPYFTNREKEVKEIHEVLNSANHLIIIAPRRYGKSSLVLKATENLNRPIISLDLQLITSSQDLAAQLLKRLYRVYPAERIRQFIKNFRIIPSITLNPLNNSVDVSFSPGSASLTILEDVLNSMEKLSRKNKKLIMVFDEFQEVFRIEKNLVQQLRSIIQYHNNISYVFLGSQESLVREIFEKKRSPFYHFGLIMHLDKISENDFLDYLAKGFKPLTLEYEQVCNDILRVSRCHPYYTQQLAFKVWQRIKNEGYTKMTLDHAISDIIDTHDMDYERIWAKFKNVDKKVLIALSISEKFELSSDHLRRFDLGATSTAYSSLKRLMKSGYAVRAKDAYEIDDPFLGRWIIRRREA